MLRLLRASHPKRWPVWIVALLLGSAATYPALQRAWTARSLAARLDRLEASRLDAQLASHAAPELDPGVSLRVQRLGPLLASWETVGGCGAGSSAGAGTVKWIGHGTTGGLFTDITQFNYIHLADGANYILSTQLSRDLGDRWQVGVFVPLLYKRYNDYLGLPVDISNAGVGDINLLGTYRMGEIRATSLTLSLGLPTGIHDATYKTIYLTQEKQLGLGRVTGTVTLDHTIDETWGIIVLGGLASWRGGTNELGSYRAPLASAYAYAGYFLGPFVPTLGLTVSGFLKPDRDRGIEQDVPLVLAAANASIEWSTDWLAILVGVSVPFGLYAKDTSVNRFGSRQSSTGIQPWTAAIGFSVSPF